MTNSLYDFINNKKNIEAFERIKKYSPHVFLIIQDSEFTRKNLARIYLSKLNIYTASIEKDNYSFFCKLDLNGEKFSAKDIIKKYKKLLIITGIGLYGETFIKDIRMFEKIMKISGNDRIPIIIFGSPKEEKLKRIEGLYDFYINNTEDDWLSKFDWVVNNIFISSQT
ncbi:MAG TPA: hypothetical protein PLE45_03895 [Spirochaetota bacterium]|nr:hypothetical protein [Spirochaetota bacterium]HOL56446.1 hypothetical protein [Spirochaetota bacterium]HPP04462.1 hypothetical protein [Spirochaetota bacterium]